MIIKFIYNILFYNNIIRKYICILIECRSLFLWYFNRNLDPAADFFKYWFDTDISDLIKITDVMESLK